MVRRALIWIMLLALALWWLVAPLARYGESTSRSVVVETLAQPFLDHGALVYSWSGEVFRSCPIEIRRSIIDSEGVVTELVALPFKRLPLSSLGQKRYELQVSVPIRIPEGPAIYQADEVSRCDWLQGLFPYPVPYPPVHFVVTR